MTDGCTKKDLNPRVAFNVSALERVVTIRLPQCEDTAASDMTFAVARIDTLTGAGAGKAVIQLVNGYAIGVDMAHDDLRDLLFAPRGPAVVDLRDKTGGYVYDDSKVNVLMLCRKPGSSNAMTEISVPLSILIKARLREESTSYGELGVTTTIDGIDARYYPFGENEIILDVRLEDVRAVLNEGRRTKARMIDLRPDAARGYAARLLSMAALPPSPKGLSR